jgi:hypothetical protein
VVPNQQLNFFKHLWRQLDGSVLLGQFLKPNSDQFLSIYSWGKTYLTFEDKILSIILHDSDSDFPWEICFTLTILPEEKKRNHRASTLWHLGGVLLRLRFQSSWSHLGEDRIELKSPLRLTCNCHHRRHACNLWQFTDFNIFIKSLEVFVLRIDQFSFLVKRCSND